MVIETPSDRDYACFLCAEGKVKDLSLTCPQCGGAIDVGPSMIGLTVSGYKLEECVGRGFYGATFKTQTRIGKPLALKIIPSRLYELNDKSFADEVERYRRLGTHPNIADLVDADSADIVVNGRKIRVHFIVMEWIEGISLRRFCERDSLDIDTVYGALLDIAAGISRFEERNTWHNDLNADNVLVKTLTQDEIQTRRSESRFILKIVDTGSAVIRQGYAHRSIDDLAFLGAHAHALGVAARRGRASISREDQFFLDELEKLVGSLVDENPTRRFPTARSFSVAVTKIYDDRFLLSAETGVRLKYPFDYLNANGFPSESYINRLFSDRFPWVREAIISAAQPTLITGPRGSGKTMILRSMRLKTRLTPESEADSAQDIFKRIERLPSISFFVSARLDIGNHAPLKKLPPWMEVDEAIIEYFHLLYLYEMCDTILFARLKGVVPIEPKAELEFCAFLSEMLNTEFVGLAGALAAIKERQAEILGSQATSPRSRTLISGAFLGDVCDRLRRLHHVFSTKQFVFLLDDFSLPKIPARVQKALLPVIWNSGSGYTFHVSAHSESIEVVDSRSIPYAVNRDYREVNLGSAYIDSLDLNDQHAVIEACIADIFAKRFQLSDQPLTDVKERLGESEAGSIAKEIRRRAEERTLHAFRYHGWDTVISLCSGDISYLIDILGQMLGTEEIAQGKKTGPIGTELQNRVIRRYARQELYRLQDYSVEKYNLYEIALNFGKMSRFKLTEDELIGKEKRPAEYLRIEVKLDHAFEQDARDAIAELVRNGVFIDGGFSASSTGTPARRLIFRKMFTPTFPTTARSRDTFSWSTKSFLEFVTKPESVLRRTIAEKGVAVDKQQPMIDGLLDTTD
jgi:serine/threonine protein kinase